MLVRLVAGPVAAIAAAAVAAPVLGLPASAPTCRPAQLRLEASFYGEAGGQFLQTFTFTNASRRECALKGWPTVTPEGRSGRPQRARSLRVIQTAPTVHAVVIGSGAAASFDVY